MKRQLLRLVALFLLLSGHAAAQNYQTPPGEAQGRRGAPGQHQDHALRQRLHPHRGARGRRVPEQRLGVPELGAVEHREHRVAAPEQGRARSAREVEGDAPRLGRGRRRKPLRRGGGGVAR